MTNLVKTGIVSAVVGICAIAGVVIAKCINKNRGYTTTDTNTTDSITADEFIQAWKKASDRDGRKFPTKEEASKYYDLLLANEFKEHANEFKKAEINGMCYLYDYSDKDHTGTPTAIVVAIKDDNNGISSVCLPMAAWL